MTISGKPYKTVRGTRNSQFAFYLDDCLNVFRELEPHSVDVIVTSPPYNLGIRYNKYEDSLNQTDYLEWTGTWVAAAARILKPHGSLFLNVGTRPSDPDGIDVAQAARAHLRLQNIIHWVKSIAIDQESRRRSRPHTRPAVGHYKPINSDRF
jgi:site-specific DNA-methyltransferase (adenine-specific)